jgi:hypothetical protein
MSDVQIIPITKEYRKGWERTFGKKVKDSDRFMFDIVTTQEIREVFGDLFTDRGEYGFRVHQQKRCGTG